MKNYYEILGVSQDATTEDISKAYRNLARKYHPDTHPTDTESALEKFKEIAEAHEVLSDVQKRRQYDATGTTGGRASPFGAAGFHFNIDPFEAFGDMFPDAFRGPWTNDRRRKGADIPKSLNLTLEEVYTGVTKEVASATKKLCDDCNGSGLESWKPCGLCNGAGRIHNRRGTFAITITCSKCHGTGRTSMVPCKQCDGDGQVNDVQTKHKVEVPRGIRQGDHVVLSGLGAVVPGGIPGDIICSITVAKHCLFWRDERFLNLHCNMPITYAQSLLGYEIEIPTLSKQKCLVKVPKGIQSGNILRLTGMGLPALRSRPGDPEFGDLLVQIQIESPQNPSPDYLDLVKKLSVLDDKEKYSKIRNFESNVKEQA